MRLTISFRTTLSGCVLAAMMPQAWQLAQTDWSAIGGALSDALILPVTAAGTDLPPPLETAGAMSFAGSEPSPARPPINAAGPGPVAQDRPLVMAEGGPPGPVALEVEEEMARLLDELRRRQDTPPATSQPPRGEDLARAALAQRLADTTRRLEEAQARFQAGAAQADAAAAAEIAKPKLIFENMKPGEAAAIITSMDEPTAAQLFAAMDERKAAAVMAAMPSDRAARIALAIKAIGAPPPPTPKRR